MEAWHGGKEEESTSGTLSRYLRCGYYYFQDGGDEWRRPRDLEANHSSKCVPVDFIMHTFKLSALHQPDNHREA